MYNQLSQLTVSLSPTTRRVIIFVPPLLLGGFYLLRRLLRSEKLAITASGNEVFDSPNSQTTTASITLNDSSQLKDNFDGCAWSADNKAKSALASNKCSHCRRNQKLSFRETNVQDASLKMFSTGQLVKYGFDNLNNAIRALEELKSKTQALKEYATTPEGANVVESQIESLFRSLNEISLDFEIFRNEFMPATYNLHAGYAAEDEDDFDDQASYLSSATTTSLGYYDPEPNLHFFQIYQDALKEVPQIKPPRTDRTIVTGSENFEDYLAKVHCLRNAFALLFSRENIREKYTNIGQEILRLILEHSIRDSQDCINSYYSFLKFILNEENYYTIEKEISHRNIAAISFYDIVLDYMILESFDDLENPPAAVKSVVNNRWLSASFREIALQTAVSAVMRRKRSKLIVPDGFFAHFYSILDYLSPIMAWGFLGSDDNLKFKLFSIKESVTAVIHDYFSFDRCRYTSYEDLCDDILRVTDERYWELNNKLSILSS